MIYRDGYHIMSVQNEKELFKEIYMYMYILGAFLIKQLQCTPLMLVGYEMTQCYFPASLAIYCIISYPMPACMQMEL